MENSVAIGDSQTRVFFDEGFDVLPMIIGDARMIIITDENVYAAHHQKLMQFPVITIPAGETEKQLSRIESIYQQLIQMEADRSTWLVGVGGGVITDITGFVAATYMRGIKFGFVPSSLLAMVDASIGGKNGVDLGVYKNMVGTIRQPDFLLYDTSLLQTLPRAEWQNGFAEIIKHAAILDREMFRELEQHNIDYYTSNEEALQRLIRRNALLKLNVVKEDEFEKGNRKLLNFGHTFGHAIENGYGLSHGAAISIGMVFAGRLSYRHLGFPETDRLAAVLRSYGLPTVKDVDRDKTLSILAMDKKKSGAGISYVLLESIGNAQLKKLSLEEIGEGWS